MKPDAHRFLRQALKAYEQHKTPETRRVLVSECASSEYPFSTGTEFGDLVQWARERCGL